MTDIKRTKHRVRLIQLLGAAERSGLAPIDLGKLHAFAYLADILSPVWNLRPFEDQIGRTGRSPFYPDLQRELDTLVAMGLVEPSEISYEAVRVEDGGEAKEIQFSANYALRPQAPTLSSIVEQLLGDEDMANEQNYLDALADALSSLPDDDIAAAATRDLAYEGSAADSEEYFKLDTGVGGSRTTKAVAAFDAAFPNTRLTPARRLFMYANFLGKRVHG
jgi:hypothetical protein